MNLPPIPVTTPGEYLTVATGLALLARHREEAALHHAPKHPNETDRYRDDQAQEARAVFDRITRQLPPQAVNAITEAAERALDDVARWASEG